MEVMGKEIDRQESPKELGKHRRLWFHKDIIQVLAENTVRYMDYCVFYFEH